MASNYDEAWNRLNRGGGPQGMGMGMGQGFSAAGGGNSFKFTEQMWIENANFEAQRARGQDIARGRGIDTIFLLDISASMSGEPFECAKEAIREIVRTIQGVAQTHGLQENVALVTMGHETKVALHLSCNYDFILGYLDTLEVRGKTPMMGGLYMALSAIVGRGSITVMNGFHVHPRIIILSDGHATDSDSVDGPDTSLYGPEDIKSEVLHLATRLGVEHHEIYCYPVGENPNENLLMEICKASNGAMISSKDFKTIGRHFKNLTAITKIKRNFSIRWDDPDEKYKTLLRTYEKGVEDSDLEDIFNILLKTDNLQGITSEEEEVCQSDLPQLGVRVERGPDWNYGNQDSGGPGTIVKHVKKPGWVKVEWDRSHKRGEYRFGADGAYDVIVTTKHRELRGELIGVGCLVTRGPDWHWGEQDGGSGCIGVVYDIQESGLVHVRWPNGHRNWYRYGVEANYDVFIWTPDDKPSEQLPVSLPPRPGTLQTEDSPSWSSPPPDVNQPNIPWRSNNQGTTTQKPSDNSNDFDTMDSYGKDKSLETDAASWPSLTDEAFQPSIPEEPFIEGKENSDVASDIPLTFSSNIPVTVSSNIPVTVSSNIPVTFSSNIPVTVQEEQPSEDDKKDETLSSEHLYHQNQVVWKWRQDSKHVDFSDEHNTKIEKAYQAKRKTSLVEINRTSYRVNFKAMNMYKVNDDKVSFTVMRVDIPKPILGMPKKKVDQYLEAVSQGKMPTRNIRLMLVGHERVGKTSLCKNLLKDRDQGSHQDRTFKGDTDGTDGIDIYIYSYEINMKTKKRTKLEKPDHQIAVQKLGNLMNEHVKKKMDEVPEDEDDDVEECADTTIPYHADSPSPAPILTSDPERKLSSSFEGKPISDDNITQVDIGHSKIITGDRQKQNFDVDDKEQEKLDRERTIPGNLLDDVKEAILASENAKPEDEMAYMSIWDFGGEDIFYDTHHIFLSSDAVYAVVFNIKECMEDEKYQERVRFWLRSIASIQGNKEVGTGKSQPPIIMVGTHLDKVPDRAIGTFHDVCGKILQGYGMVSIRDQIKHYCPVDNYNESPENEQKFEDLWEYIIEAASSQSQWEKDIPIKWFTLERELMKKKQSGTKVMTLKEVVDLDNMSESPIKIKEHIKLCLRYLHLTGVVLYFEDDLLEHFPKDEEVKLIIDPQWVVNAFRRLITVSKFTDNSKTAMSWQFMNSNKELTRPFLEQFWNRPEDKQYKFLEHMEDLLKFMVKTGLLAQPVLQIKGEEVIKKDYYIVPSILDKPNYDWIDRHFQQKDLVSTHTLNITFEQMYIPFPVFHKLLAAFIVRFKFLDDDSTNLKKGFACFEVNPVWHLCIFCFNSTVKLTMSKYEQFPGRASIKAGIGKLVREFVVDTMECILKAHGHYCKNISYQLSVCRYLKEGDKDVMVNVKDLQDLEEGGKIKRREEYFSRHDLKPWFCFQEEEGKAVAVPDFYPALNRTPTDVEFQRICKQIPITENMRSFFLELGVPDHDINIIKEDEKEFVPICYKAFQKWKQLFPKEATTRRIVEALKKLNKDFTFLKSGIFDE